MDNSPSAVRKGTHNLNRTDGTLASARLCQPFSHRPICQGLPIHRRSLLYKIPAYFFPPTIPFKPPPFSTAIINQHKSHTLSININPLIPLPYNSETPALPSYVYQNARSEHLRLPRSRHRGHERRHPCSCACTKRRYVSPDSARDIPADAECSRSRAEERGQS